MSYDWDEADDDVVTDITATPYVRTPAGVVLVTRLLDGRIMCCLCFEYVARSDLYRDPEDGSLVDVCKTCHDIEESTSARAQAAVDVPQP